MGCCCYCWSKRHGSRKVVKEAPLTVKEVEEVDKQILSETPTATAKPPNDENEKHELDRVSSEKVSELEPKFEASGAAHEAKSFEQEEVNDEEAYSLNESRVTEIRDDVEVAATSRVKQRPNRSPARHSTRGSMQRLAARPSLQIRHRAVSNPKPRRQSPVRKSPGGVSGPEPTKSGPNRVGHGRMEESLENPLVSLECFIFL